MFQISVVAMGLRLARYEAGAMDLQNEIVAIGLLTQRDVDGLGSALKKVFLVDRKLMFFELLQALDEAEIRARESE